MTEPSTPAEWLPVLAERIDTRRAGQHGEPGVDKLRRYARGQSDMPEMGKNVRASWEAFQRKARTDYGGAALRSLRNRIRPNGYRIGRTHDHPTPGALRRIDLDNAPARQLRDAVRDYLETGTGYITVRRASGGGVLVRRERPEVFYALPDAEKPWKGRASLKVWRDDVAGRDFARVSLPGASQLFVRPSANANGTKHATAAGGGWEPAAEAEGFDGDAQTVIFDRDDDGAFLSPHLDVIDRINLGKLQRLVTTAMQAYRQRALRAKEGAGLRDTHDDGNAVDLDRVFEPAPGALWDLPEGIDIWESQHTDITPMLSGETQDARDFAAATGTPISVLIPDGQNQSAEGAAAAKEQQIEQARDDVARIRPAAELVLVYALRAAGVTLAEGDEVEWLFAPPEHVSLSERYAAAVQAKGAGLSARTIKRDILGMTPDQIEQDEADAGADMLAAALMGRPAARQGADTADAEPVTEEGADGGRADAGAA